MPHTAALEASREGGYGDAKGSGMENCDRRQKKGSLADHNGQSGLGQKTVTALALLGAA